MPDKLTQLFDEFMSKQPKDEATIPAFQVFQAGFTASAVSMRQRSLDIVDKANLGNIEKNNLKNKIGSLPDIPN